MEEINFERSGPVTVVLKKLNNITSKDIVTPYFDKRGILSSFHLLNAAATHSQEERYNISLVL